MAKLPNPDTVGFSAVAFYSTIGSAVRFELDNDTNLRIGDAFVFKSTGGSALWDTFSGEYVVAGTAFDGAVYKIFTTCIGTVDAAGS
jgi:hypothetical protein